MERKLKHGELKWFVPSHTATYWQTQDENSYPWCPLGSIHLFLLFYIQGYLSLFTFCLLFKNPLNLFFKKKRGKKGGKEGGGGRRRDRERVKGKEKGGRDRGEAREEERKEKEWEKDGGWGGRKKGRMIDNIQIQVSSSKQNFGFTW